jgi:hypothetical protein
MWYQHRRDIDLFATNVLYCTTQMGPGKECGMLTSVHFSVILLLVYRPDTERCSFLVRLART